VRLGTTKDGLASRAKDALKEGAAVFLARRLVVRFVVVA